MATQVTEKRKFVADAAFEAALDEVLNRVLAEDGYSGVEVKVATTKAVVTEIPTKEEASPAMRGGMEGMGDMGSTKTKQ